MTDKHDTRRKESHDRCEDAGATTRVKHPDNACEEDGTRVDTRREQRAETPAEARDRAADDATRVQPSEATPGDAESDPGPTEVAAGEVEGAVSKGRPYAGTSSAIGGQPANGSLGIGSILRERFRIEGVLGEGGMGIVFKAVDLLKQEARDENVHVGLKVMKPDLFSADMADMNFLGLQREARRAQQLAHPNIVTVYDFDRADGYIYMTMEYLRGKPLDQVLKENRHGLDRQKAHDITMQVGAGLAYAHREGIVHVDLKPQNIFVLDSGRAKILDFGIAKAYQARRADRVEATFSGYSPPFASPQVIARERPVPSDDVFALAIVVYGLYTGRHPFDWEPADKAREKGLKPRHDGAFRRAEWRAIRSALSFERPGRPPDADAFLARFAPSKIRRVAMAVSAGSVVAAVSFMLLYEPAPGPETPFAELPQPVQGQVRAELDDAAEFARLGDINSSLQLYDSVLNLHPGNTDATAGMQEVVGGAVERIAAARGEGQLSPERARASLQSMLSYETLPRAARERIEEELGKL